MLDSLQFFHFGFFLFFCLFFGILEYFFPLRKKIAITKKRLLHNFSLSVINTLFVRIFAIITPVGMAGYMAEKGIGLFNYIHINFVVELFLGIILLDGFIYFQHVYAHKWKWFWKFHSIHHSDIFLDLTTAIRFHTLEIIISIIFKIILVFIFGFDPLTVVIFEILLVTSAMFNHSNIKLPNSIDKVLSLVIVTPNFHQVHHSVIHKETDSNYGFFLSIWDKIFKTYTPHNFRVKKIGLSENKDNLSFTELLLLDINKK